MNKPEETNKTFYNFNNFTTGVYGAHQCYDTGNWHEIDTLTEDLDLIRAQLKKTGNLYV
jgi:hypothetical protein